MLVLLGQCFVETGGQRSPLRLGDAVHVGDAVEAEAEAKLKLRMNGGSIIAIASNSRLTIPDYQVGEGGESRAATLSLGKGLLRAAVSSLSGATHFEVDAATGVVGRSSRRARDTRPGRRSRPSAISDAAVAG